MADGFYLKHGNQEYGPMDSNKLRQLAAQNKINPTDLIRKGTEGKWTPASNVKGLFPEQGAARPMANPSQMVSPPIGTPTPVTSSQSPTPVAVPPIANSMSFESLGNIATDDSHKTAKHGGKRGKKKQPMDRKTMLIASIAGGTVLLLIVVIALIFILKSGKKQETKATNNSEVAQKVENADGSTETKPVADGENPQETTATGEENAQKPVDGENADEAIPADNADNAEANNPEATNGEEKTTSVPKNALDSTEVGKAGDLEVKITSVKRGIQDTIQKDGTEDMSEDKSTIITLSVKNVNAEKTVKFTPWSVSLSRGMKGATLTDNNGNDYPFALKSGEIAKDVKKETATLYSDDPAVTDILVFKRYVPAAKELYLTLPVPGNMKESVVFKIDVANIGKGTSTNPDEPSADVQVTDEKTTDNNPADKKVTDEKSVVQDTPVADDTADTTADDANEADYNEMDGVSEAAQKRDQEQADKELKELNLGDE